MPEPQAKSKCCLKLSKKVKFTIFHLLDSVLLLAVQIIQGAVLNHYIIAHYKQHQYLLYGLDLSCSAIFVIALYSSYQYISYCIDHNECPDKRYTASPKRLLSRFPTSKLGMLPLSYLSWLIYVAILLIKLQIIFGVDLFVILQENNSFAPQLLKIIIGLSSLVFLLLVEAHNQLEVHSERYNYVTSVCSKVGIEIFDSVSLLSVLLLGDQVPPPFEHLVFVLAGLNFLLPALSLYRLSLPDTLMSKLDDKYPLQLMHHLSRTFLIEIPFLTVRMFLWITYEEEASMFMMKNIFNILVTFRTLHPELVEFLSRDDRRDEVEMEGRGEVDGGVLKGVEERGEYIPHFECEPLRRAVL
uniref:Uncharacterized protein n=1 Tax=Cacopsylla melanoneura TaxID=428564 RepID=A0A8D8SQN0_9HEMI